MTAKLFLIPFGKNGLRGVVPDAAQPDGSVSYDQGFGPDYERQLGVDPQAKNIGRGNFNEVIYDLSLAQQETQAGVGAAVFSAAMATAINGYSKGAVIPRDSGRVGNWISTANNNFTDPETLGSSWLPFGVVGTLSKSLSNTTVELTTSEAAYPTLLLTGTLTANVSVIVPSGWVYTWNVRNRTTGAFSVTVKTSDGAGVVVRQGASSLVSTLGVDVADTLTDFDSIAITGVSTCPTAPLGTNTDQLASMAAIKQATDAVNFPPGAVLPFAQTAAPTGWLKANGAAVSRTAYANLFAAIGTTFGGGDGSTTFNVPELRGEFIRGFTDGRAVDAGRVFGSAQVSENLSHAHTATAATDTHDHTSSGTTVSDGWHQHNVTYNRRTSGSGEVSAGTVPFAGVAASNSGQVVNATEGAGAHTHAYSNTTSSDVHTHALTVGSTGGTESRPRNVALLLCIKF
jgi:microcystin-dependent protein